MRCNQFCSIWLLSFFTQLIYNKHALLVVCFVVYIIEQKRGVLFADEHSKVENNLTLSSMY